MDGDASSAPAAWGIACSAISARGSGILLLLIIAAIAVFLVAKAIPALKADKANFLTSQAWNPDAAEPRFGILQLAFGTLLSSFMALILATPVAIGIALFIAFYSPRRLASGLGYVVDLLAAVPSVVYGLWGLQFFVPKMASVAELPARRLRLDPALRRRQRRRPVAC